MKAIDVAQSFMCKSNTRFDPLYYNLLTYLAHGWMLGVTGSPLIKEPIEAWENCPVIPLLYISMHKIVYANKVEMRLVPFINDIWNLYHSFSLAELVAVTTLENSPWEKTDQYERITDKSLFEYYRNKITYQDS